MSFFMQSDVSNGIPRLQSMLEKLNLKHQHPKTDCVKLHPEAACKGVFYHSLEPEEGIKMKKTGKIAKSDLMRSNQLGVLKQKKERKLLKKSKSFHMCFLNGRGRVYSLTLCL